MNHVTRQVLKEVEDYRWTFGDQLTRQVVQRFDNGNEDVFSRNGFAKCEAQAAGRGAEVGPEGLLVDIDPDAGNDTAINQVREDAGYFTVPNQDIIGPAKIALQIIRLLDTLGNGYRHQQAGYRQA